MRRGLAQSWRSEASVSKMGGASGQKLPYQRPLTRPLIRWTCCCGVEDERGAGGEFAVENDEVVGSRLTRWAWLMARARSFGAEDGVEAGQAFVGGQQDDGHAGGEGEVGGVGAAAAAEEIAAEADGEHAEGDSGERAAEESPWLLR